MHGLAERLTELSRETWERGRILPSLAMKKLFEKPGEAYHDWNSSLPGYQKPHQDIAEPFETADDLRAAFRRAVEVREKLRAEMIARQEEMDWLVYEAYGLIETAPVLTDDADLTLDREMRPFRLWEKAEGEFEAAAALMPSEWSESKCAVWRERLALIRDNEHVRRIERPVYKRRWDEQWKVGNTWQCGPVAYDAEFRDAFYWWLSEKAEWLLERKLSGGPATLSDWTAALWADARVQAAWQVAAEATCQLEAWKRWRQESPAGPEPTVDSGRDAFGRYFRALVNEQSVPDNIPWAEPWDELASKGVSVPAKAKRIRGKLNVPRERFWSTSAGTYRTVRVP